VADDDTAPIDRAPRDSLTALHADLLAGMVDGNTAATRLEALMDEMKFLQSTYTLPALPEDIAVEVPEPQMPVLEKVDEPDEEDA
jgi:hypothetical protein